MRDSTSDLQENRWMRERSGKIDEITSSRGKKSHRRLNVSYLKNENAKASNVGNSTRMPFFSFARKEPDIKKKIFLVLNRSREKEGEKERERERVREKGRVWERNKERKREKKREGEKEWEWMMHVYDDILFSLGTVGWWALEVSGRYMRTRRTEFSM